LDAGSGKHGEQTGKILSGIKEIPASEATLKYLFNSREVNCQMGSS
jgi:hypothetical protein